MRRTKQEVLYLTLDVDREFEDLFPHPCPISGYAMEEKKVEPLLMEERLSLQMPDLLLDTV